MKFLKLIKTIGIICLSAFLFVAFVMFIFEFFIINVINSDLYGRLIDTKSFGKTSLGNSKSNSNLPSLTLILHSYLQDENTIECSIALNYDRQELFRNANKNILNFQIKVNDGFNYDPIGINKFYTFLDSITHFNFNNSYSGYETPKFKLPVSASVIGFPYDNIMVLPIIYLFEDSVFIDYKFNVQKRIIGRIFNDSKMDDRIIELTRTSIEKYMVVICSIIFIIITLILAFRLFAFNNQPNRIEEIIAVAGYMLATAEFRNILGFNNLNGTSAMELLVILIPLLTLFVGLIYSLNNSAKPK